MTFDQIRYFISLVEHDTYFDAAEELHISQSSLSKQILKLEKELGLSLIDRSHRKASLTPAGETFYQHALQLYSQYELMIKHLKKYLPSDQHTLRVGTLPILTQYGLTAQIRQFTQSHPDIRLILDEVEENDLKKGFLAGQYDLIICREKIFSDLNLPDLSSVCLAEDELVVALPVNHLLTESVSLDHLANEEFILMNRYTSVYQICQDLFSKAHIHPTVLRTARVESILSAVAIGEGISLLPYSNFRLFQHDYIKTISLTPPVKLPVMIAGNKKRMNSSLCREFIHALTQD